MSGVELRVENRRFLRACGPGLSERTALVELSVHGQVVRELMSDTRMRQAASSLYRAEPLFGLTDDDWPGAFLVPGSDHSDTDELRWLGNWVVAVTVAIQRWAHDPVFRGRVSSVAPGRLKLAIPWFGPAFFDEALSAAIHFVSQWLDAGRPSAEATPPWLSWLGSGRPTSVLERHFDGRWDRIQSQGLGAVTLRFVEAAVRRGMPFDVQPSCVQIGWGANAKRFDWASTGQTSWLAMGVAKDKSKAGLTLAGAGIPVPRAVLADDVEAAQNAAGELGWPVVIKPHNKDGGAGVVVGITDPARLARAFDEARRYGSGPVLVEKHCPGDDYRLLVVHGRVVQVVRRRPAQVIGDGAHSVSRLVDRLNEDPRRGTQDYSLLKRVELGDDVLDCLAQQGLQPGAVPTDGRPVWLSRIGNISAGGTAENVGSAVHPDNMALAVRATRIVGLDIAGVDFLSPDVSRSWREVGGVVCEVNGQPGFRPHWLADPGRDIHGEVLDIVFDGSPARIPTAAIAGTNGKTTTAEMLYRIWTEAGKVTGVCTTARVRIGDQTVSTDNLSGQPGARIILNDPAVQAAVLEMPRKGLILFGHHCDRYDVAALLNVQDDHIGVDGIETMEQMAELKAEVLERATGAIVVNAEDPLCLAMRGRAGTTRHILVARSPDADAVVDHRLRGGEAVFLGDRDGRPWIILATGAAEAALMPVRDVPATMNGLLAFNETNALFATALAWVQGIDVQVIRRALGAFGNSVEENPGRYNFIDGLPFDVLVDFAHNPDGVRGICSVATGLAVTGRRLLCSLNIGNRHPDHFAEVAPLLADTFDEFVVGTDPVEVASCPGYAGEDPAAAMVERARAILVGEGVAADRIRCKVDRLAAIGAAFGQARPGDLVVLLADYGEAQQAVDDWRLRTHANSSEIRSR